MDVSVCPLAAENKVLVWLERSGVQRTLLVSLPVDVETSTFLPREPEPSELSTAQQRSPWTCAKTNTCLCAGEADSLPHVCAGHGSVVHRSPSHICYEG